MKRSRLMGGTKSSRGQLAPHTPNKCRDCARLLVPRRTNIVPGVSRQHYGHGICMVCARIRRNAGQDMDGPRLPAPRGTVRWSAKAALAEYELLRERDQLTKRQVAERIGMTLASFERALCRARRQIKREAEDAARLVELLALELEAHRINDDMNAYALRKAS